MSHPRDFHFDGMVVGYFKESGMPRATGRFRYMPYRGPGHYELGRRREAGGSPRCYCDIDDVRVSFTVRDCPEYGVLELCDFDTPPRTAAMRCSARHDARVCNRTPSWAGSLSLGRGRTNIDGFFLGTNRSGQFILQPQRRDVSMIGYPIAATPR